ncbi:TBC1D2B [Mytilus coruscus]|uniref:TBC1D2B n=1 Tax=Mytilus coruscus TaxID=42192 RepID=A0A6J8AGQ0_MYTCO|nr:TBC1D2B [Mytilus coruscus]
MGLVKASEEYLCSSLSSDSAIDRGDASSAELAGRLQDLEKELISTKCELAKVMNRQSSYQELLVQREDAIRFLEGRLDTSSVSELAKTGSGKSSSKNDKDLQERLRVLQNQNKFLNEEVKKLAKLRETDRNSFYQQEEKIRTLEAEIEKWKLDYVLLIQSSIRFPTGDSVEDAELILFGGDRHKIRIKRLLEEARRINPGLPTYESLSNQEVHVDSYGFRHKFEDQSLLLHYLCQELAQHYLSQAGTYEEHQKRWTHFMRQHGKSVASHPKELKPLCRGGIPDRFRKQVWRQLVHFKCKDIMEEKGPHYFRNLCSHLPDSPLASQYRKQISLDLMRTMPSNIKFSAPGSKGIMDLQDVLLAYCCHNPTIGYCQGMNFIVGMALLFMDAQDAFWTLVAVAEKFFSNHYFDQNLIGAQADQQVLKDLLAHRLPQLYRHLEAIDIELSTVTLNWFLAIFFDAVPFMV